MRFPGLRAFIGREELTRLKKSSFITWQKVCKLHGLKSEINWHYNGQENYLDVLNGNNEASRIDFLELKYLPSDPDFERFGSVEYTVGWIEEGSEVDFGAFDILKSRVGRHRNQEYGIIGKLLITLNPTKGWPYRVIYKPWTQKILNPRYAFIQSLYKDNPYTADIYKNQLDSLTSKVKRLRLRDGKWEYDDEKGVLMPYDAINDIFAIAPIFSEELFLTCDVARFGGDRIVIKLWRGFKIEKIWVYQFQKTTWTSGKIKEILNEYRIPRSHLVVDEDGVGGGIVDELEGCVGFVANSTPFKEEAMNELEANYANLKAQCGYKLAEKVNKREISALDFKIITDIEGMDEEKVKELLI